MLQLAAFRLMLGDWAKFKAKQMQKEKMEI